MKSNTFRKLVEGSPENELFRFSLAQALLDEENPAEAIPHLEFCAGKRRDWMVARILLGKARLALGDREAARTNLEGALQLAIEQEHETPEAEIRALLDEIGPGPKKSGANG